MNLFYHIKKDETTGEFVYHEFYTWYSDTIYSRGGLDKWKRFSILEDAEKYAKDRGGFNAYF
jgi:hypothetical protein